MAMPCCQIFLVRQHLGMSDFEISMVADGSFPVWNARV